MWHHPILNLLQRHHNIRVNVSYHMNELHVDLWMQSTREIPGSNILASVSNLGQAHQIIDPYSLDQASLWMKSQPHWAVLRPGHHINTYTMLKLILQINKMPNVTPQERMTTYTPRQPQTPCHVTVREWVTNTLTCDSQRVSNKHPDMWQSEGE